MNLSDAFFSSMQTTQTSQRHAGLTVLLLFQKCVGKKHFCSAEAFIISHKYSMKSNTCFCLITDNTLFLRHKLSAQVLQIPFST